VRFRPKFSDFIFRFFFAVFVFRFVFFPVPCPRPFSAYRDALNHDAQYAAARRRARKTPQGRAGLLPSVSLNASVVSNRQESQLRYPGASSGLPIFI
jgi:hypothetical protein